MLTDRGADIAATPASRIRALSGALEDIDHSRTKTKARKRKMAYRWAISLKTVLIEFYRVVSFRKKISDRSPVQADAWIKLQ